MPQSKKPGSSGRKPAARKPAAGKPAASRSSRKGPAQKQAPPPGQPKASAASAQETRDAKRREEQLLAAIASLRDLLTKGVVITGDRLQEAVDDAVARGRMTRQDAEDLVQNLISIGRRQSQDALGEIEDLVERSATQTRRAARARVKSVGAAARRAPGTDRALRTVDRVRRVAGLGHPFPIIGYDDLTAAQVRQRLAELNAAELRKVRDYERRNANRKSVLTAIERMLE
jgi:polyhydroxyalkanoate synthesis regulator phasin